MVVGIPFDGDTLVLAAVMVSRRESGLPVAEGLPPPTGGSEDARDWVIAYGQAVARVMWQPKHGNLHAKFLADFPKKGVVKDLGSWLLPEGAKNGEGVQISGYLGGFYPAGTMRCVGGRPLAVG